MNRLCEVGELTAIDVEALAHRLEEMGEASRVEAVEADSEALKHMRSGALSAYRLAAQVVRSAGMDAKS